MSYPIDPDGLRRRTQAFPGPFRLAPHRSAPKRGMAFIEDILLSPKNLGLREGHLLAG